MCLAVFECAYVCVCVGAHVLRHFVHSVNPPSSLPVTALPPTHPPLVLSATCAPCDTVPLPRSLPLSLFACLFIFFLRRSVSSCGFEGIKGLCIYLGVCVCVRVVTGRRACYLTSLRSPPPPAPATHSPPKEPTGGGQRRGKRVREAVACERQTGRGTGKTGGEPHAITGALLPPASAATLTGARPPPLPYSTSTPTHTHTHPDAHAGLCRIPSASSARCRVCGPFVLS